jgi:hypothetical protein
LAENGKHAEKHLICLEKGNNNPSHYYKGTKMHQDTDLYICLKYAHHSLYANPISSLYFFTKVSTKEDNCLATANKLLISANHITDVPTFTHKSESTQKGKKSLNASCESKGEEEETLTTSSDDGIVKDNKEDQILKYSLGKTKLNEEGRKLLETMNKSDSESSDSDIFGDNEMYEESNISATKRKYSDMNKILTVFNAKRIKQ